MSNKPEPKAEEIPEIIYDANTKQSYKRQRFFGKVRIVLWCYFN